ncbi:MAG: DUF1080 domain-containing protein [Proteobacteria bacterium]|nr:DUF1080 domain-containing protein [Pseudomonadota bacterium]
MRIFPLVLLLTSLTALFSGPRAGAADFTPEPGFTLLFNGKNLDGWQTAKTPKPEPLQGKTEAFGGRFKVVDGILVYDPAVKGNLYIETTKEFTKDVHIKLDFQAGPKCNNDFFLRGTKFDVVPGVKETKNVKEGDWSTLEIIVQGDKVEHKVGGETVRTSKAGAANTRFMLRAEFGAIQIRNIRVKE